jgi:hypothetical protein
LGSTSGLSLIALGSGGIKPCVASFVGDQFDQTNKHRTKGCSMRLLDHQFRRARVHFHRRAVDRAEAKLPPTLAR